MALLITLFLVLINIFNNITTNSPKAEGLTAIEIWMLACILFVFGELTFSLTNYVTTRVILLPLHSRVADRVRGHPVSETEQVQVRRPVAVGARLGPTLEGRLHAPGVQRLRRHATERHKVGATS